LKKVLVSLILSFLLPFIAVFAGASSTGGTSYWLIGLVVLAITLAAMLLKRRSSSYIRYIGGYRYFAVLFYIFKRNVFYVLDLINGRW